MKKAGVLLLMLLILSILSIIFVQVQQIQAQELNEETGLPSELEKVQNISEKGKETVEKISDKEKREYLFQEWKNLLLKNKVISAIDLFFTKISPAFLVLFGEPYALSGFLLIIIILWFYFFFKLSEIMIDFSPFSSGVGWVIGLGLTIVLAQIQILRKIAEFFIWFVFYKEATWWRFAATLIIIFALFFIYYFSSVFSKAYKEQKKKTKQEIREAKLEAGEKIAEDLIKGAGEGI